MGNKLRSQADREFLVSNLPGFEFLGFIPYDQAVVDADQANLPIFDASRQVITEVRNIYQALVSAAQISGVVN